jgi:hypothetical protein
MFSVIKLNEHFTILKRCTASHKSFPPLDQWHPKHCGKMDLKVKANGEWWHEGQLIKRQAY